jgi:hypothetical protein
MQINPHERWGLQQLIDEDYFKIDNNRHRHKDSFEYVRARATSCITRLYRPERARYVVLEQGNTNASKDLVRTTDLMLQVYAELDAVYAEFYKVFRWCNPHTIWSGWNDWNIPEGTPS